MAQPLPDPDRGPLAELIWAQTLQEVGIPVLLFTTPALAEAEAPGAAGGRDPAAALRQELELDGSRLSLFSTDAYLLQCALGAQLLPEQP